ncbi:MAG: hypothetical protein KAG56_09160 [Sulfurovaceae bacterium]|nr:hypothetical protein [Sulfurovaceae bacterium]
MCDFNNLTDEEKLQAHQLLLTTANKYGGVNFFLQLIESIRNAETHPLCSRHRDFLFEYGDVRWTKVIFNDKIQLIQKIRQENHTDKNFLPSKASKDYKRVLNLLRTLDPIVFSVRPALRDKGEGFDFPAFDKIDENTTHLNPLFDALFFCSMDMVKRILNYKN